MSTQDRRHGLVGFVQAFAKSGFTVSAAIGGLFAYTSGDWILLPAMIAFWLFWRTLPAHDAPPGLQFAFSFHLFQIVAGSMYTTLTGRYLTAHDAPQYHLMMVIAVVSIVVMFGGFLLGDYWLRRTRRPIARVHLDITLTQLFIAYVIAVLSRDLVVRIAFQIPTFTQAIIAISAAQAGILYLVLRRLFRDGNYVAILPLLLFETARGFTGYYSSFKEPIILALIAFMEVFQPRKVGHWTLVTVLVGSVLGTSVLWLGIRGTVRVGIDQELVNRGPTERFQLAYAEALNWWQTDREYKMYDVDALAERVWDVYYTALTLDRVPSLVPHEEGAIMWAAIQHVLTPRFLNPNKPVLPSESEDVAKYSGMQVAGREQGTTIAFGYVIQSYIDFGIPWMFLAPLGFGIFMGAAYRWFMTTIHHEEILIAVVAMGFWLNLMAYNTSWAKMLGKLITSLVYMGGIAILIDRSLYRKRVHEAETSIPQPTAPVR
jgi:hypothetical protein